MLISHFVYGDFTLCVQTFQNCSTMLNECVMMIRNPNSKLLVWPVSRSLAATKEIDVSFFSSPYLDVSVQAVPPAWLCIHHAVTGVFPAGFPHSEINGSRDICSSPSLIAACHVLHRLLVPRHPPCALSYLTSRMYSVTCSVSYCFGVCHSFE